MKWRLLRRLLLCIGLLAALAGVLWPLSTPRARADDNLTLSPAGGPPGTVIALTPNQGAQTFSPGVVLQPYYLSGCSGDSGAGAVFPINGDGSIPTMTITIPLTETACPAVAITVAVYPSNQPNVIPVYAYGPYNFAITGAGSTAPPTPTATFLPGASLAPTLAVNATVTTAGQQLLVTGSNYTPGDQVSVALALPGVPNSPLPGTVQTVQIPSTGALALTYSVPVVTPGSYLLTAVGQPSNRAATPISLLVQTTSVVASPTPATGFQPFATETPPAVSSTPPLIGFPTSTPVVLPTSTATAPAPTPTPTPRPAPAETTYFAEGYTGQVVHGQGVSFKEQLYLFNTTDAATTASVTYFIAVNASGATRTAGRQVRLPAMGAAVQQVNAVAGNNQLVSITVRHVPGVTARVVISRTDAKGRSLDAAATTGSARAAPTWYFAEGYTGVTFQEYVSIFNPSSAPATVHLHFATSSGSSPVALSYSVPRSGRLSLNIGALYLRQAGFRAPKSISLLVSSNQNIVVDRTLYWGAGAGSGKYGYAIVPGAVSGAASLLFPVLSPTAATESYLTILNPNPVRAGLQIVFRGAGGHVVTSYTNTMAPLSRLTVPLSTAVPAGTGLVSATLNATAPLVAEAPLYSNGSPNSGEHAGIDLTSATASTSEALAGVDSTNAALYVYNPNASPLQVKGTFGASSGLATQGLITVPALHIEVVALPGASGPRGLLLTAPAPFAAALLNGISAPVSWGNVLIPTQEK